MNVFKIIGDFLHTFAIVFLPVSILKNKSYAGISHRTQLLLCMVFVTRYLDLFQYFESYYNSIMKCFFITVTLITFLMGYWYKDLDQNDNFNSEVLLFFSMMVAVANYTGIGKVEIFWSFSENLEALAIVPQVYMILKTKKVTKAMIIYMTSTVLYRIFYCFNYIHRSLFEGSTDNLSDVTGMGFIFVYGLAMLLMVCSGVKTFNNETDGMLKRNIFSRVMVPTMVFSISSNVNHITDNTVGSDGAPLVKQIELSQKEKELIQTI